MSQRRCTLLLIALALGACPAKRQQPPVKDTLVIQAENEPVHLLTMIQPDAWAHRIAAHNLFESLIRLDPRSYEIRGELAASWQVAEDQLTYTFKLRPGVRWHDGRPFSGKDVLFTLERLLDERVRAASARASLAPFIESYELTAPDTVQIRCKRPSAFFLVALSDLAILPAHLMSEGDLNSHPLLRRPVGTGPYRFVSWERGRQITLERFEGYWGAKPRIKRLAYRFVATPETALQLARRKELDFISRLRAAQWTGVVQKDPVLQHEFVVTRHYPPGTSYILLNHQRPLFGDVRVRRALALLLDVQTVASKIYQGLARPVGALYWFKEPDYNQAVEPLGFDPARAQELLAAAGFRDSDQDGVLDRDGQPFRFTFHQIAGSQTSKLWATIWQQELKKAGIVLEISPIDWAAYVERLRAHDFDAGPLFMTLVGPFSDLYLQFHSSQAEDGQNYGAYQNPEVDRLLEKIRSTLDAEQRRPLSLEVQALLARDVAVIPLFAMEDPGIVSRRVHGVYSSALWFQPRDWWIE